MKSKRVAVLPLALLSFSCAPGASEALELGSRSDAIINGHPASAAEAWGTVGLIAEDASEGSWTCTGTLVAPRVVITAAHCLLDSRGKDLPTRAFTVVSGAVDLVDAQENQQYAVSIAKSHPEAFANEVDPNVTPDVGQENDIAVLVTTSDVRDVTPIALFPLDRIDSLLSDGTQVTLAGYGVRSEDEIDDFNAPTEHYVGTASYVRRSDFEFQAGKGETESDTCVGDSGGPVYFEVDGQMTVLGATSRGIPNTDKACGDGGIYTLVPAYEAWIRETAQGAFDAEPGGDGDGDGSVGDGDGDGQGDGDDDGSAGDGDGDGEEDGDSGDGDGDGTPSSTRKKDSGCSVSPGQAPTGSAWFAMFAAFGFLVRRRARKQA